MEIGPRSQKAGKTLKNKFWKNSKFKERCKYKRTLKALPNLYYLEFLPWWVLKNCTTLHVYFSLVAVLHAGFISLDTSPAFYITACLPSYPIAAACSQLMSLALHLLIMFMFCIVFAHFLIFTFMYHQSGQNVLNLLLPSFTKTKESDRSLHSCF